MPSQNLSTVVDKRRRRTNLEIADMRETMLAILRSDHPQSVRHVFYRMTDPRLSCAVEKSERGYRHVQYQLSEMRKAGVLPYGWIVDATRTGYFVDTFDSATDFIERVSGLYRADLWKNSDVYLEVWVESRSIAGVIKSICTEYCVPLRQLARVPSHRDQPRPDSGVRSSDEAEKGGRQAVFARQRDR